jgi:serine/threonine-protein kinase
LGKTIGPFAIDKQLGAGAMGAVYRAKHAESGKWVAIKIIGAAHVGNEVSMQRFEREWEILKQLRHPNIVRLLASGRFAGTPFYAMEYVEGEGLDKVIARRGRIEWEEVVRLGRQLCAGLQHAHDKGIIHRDLKPSNVMILKDGTVKLTDFGIAKDLDRTAITDVNSTVGTAAYMSPEQCKGHRDLTYKSDLYSMGVMFYELLTGKKPFLADSSLDMFMQHIKGTFERPSRLALDIPIFLDTLVCQLMEKEPERRPFSAAIVSESLERVAEKVASQQAAGLDTKTLNAATDEQDKEAMRALHGKKKKKRRRGKAAFYRQTGFKAAALSTLLLAIVAMLLAFVLVKPSPETLYQRAAQAMASDNLEVMVEARKAGGPIYDYLRYYGDRDDEQAAKIRHWADAVDVEECERLLLRRLRGDINTNVDPEELICREAIEAEDDGKLQEARNSWLQLAKYKDAPQQPDPSEKRSYGLFAYSRLQMLDEVEKREKKLKELASSKDAGSLHEPAGDYEKLAARAFLLEVAKSPQAGEIWDLLRKKLDHERDAPATRVWWLMAKKHIRALPVASRKAF